MAVAALRVLVVCLISASVLDAQWAPGRAFAQQATAPAEGKPALRPERVAGEVLGGTYAGVLGYFVGRGVGQLATAMMSAERDAQRERIVNSVGISAAAFAIGGAVYGVGNMGAEAGSFPKTMVGVSAGVAASLLLSKVVFNGRMPSNEASSHRKWLMATLESSLPAIGGTIAFNSSRRWQR